MFIITNSESTKAFEKSLITSQNSLGTRGHNSESYPLARNISRQLPNTPISKDAGTEQNEAVNEIEAMNNLLVNPCNFHFKITYRNFSSLPSNLHLNFKSDGGRDMIYNYFLQIARNF